MRRALLLLGLAACGKFQDPNIVVDLRVIGMTASLPEQVIDVDELVRRVGIDREHAQIDDDVRILELAARGEQRDA